MVTGSDDDLINDGRGKNGGGAGGGSGIVVVVNPKMENLKEFYVSKLPKTLDEALKTSSGRRLVFLSYRQVMLSCLDTLESLAHGVKELIPAGCKWLQEVCHRYPLTEQRDLTFRVAIYGALRKIHTTISAMHPPPTNKDQVINIMKSAIWLEPAFDLVNLLFVDTENWNRDEELWDLAWGIYVDGFEAGGSGGTGGSGGGANGNGNGSGGGGDFKSNEMEKLISDLLELPFCEPVELDEERLNAYIKDIRSRSDGYCLLFAALERQTTKMYNLLSKPISTITATPTVKQIMVSPGGGGATRSKSVVKFGRRPTIDFSKRERDREKERLEVVASPNAKVEWIVGFISRNLHSCSPSPVLATAGINILRRISKVIDLDSNNVISRDAFGELESRLRYSYERHQTYAKSGSSPPLIMNPIAGQSSLTKLLQAKRKTTASPLQSTGSQSPLNSLDNIAPDSHMKFDGDDILVAVEDAWFQVDPFVERIVLKPPPGQNEKYSEETLVSIQSGTLVITRNELIWTTQRSVTNGFSLDSDTGMRIPHSTITRFNFVKMDNVTTTSGNKENQGQGQSQGGGGNAPGSPTTTTGGGAGAGGSVGSNYSSSVDVNTIGTGNPARRQTSVMSSATDETPTTPTSPSSATSKIFGAMKRVKINNAAVVRKTFYLAIYTRD
ncbi:hypothetical protein HDU76_001576, partial [Blyttiomyces sp. JEL0837]